MDLAEWSGQRRTRSGPRDPEMRKARVCYDHLAGAYAVKLFARLTRLRLIALDDGTIAITSDGERRLREFGIDIAALKSAKRPICRACPDWSERRPHLAGALGASSLDRFFDLRWARRVEGSRAVRFTQHGEITFPRLFD